MAKPTKLSSKTIRLARQQMETAQTAEDVRRALCILLPAELGITQTCAAHVLHLGLATVKRYQTALFLDAHEKRPQHRRRGGRHHETLSVDGEREFLAKWSQRAAQGGVVVVSDLREAIQRQAGKKVRLSTVYRMLARHGWRKVAPDTRHPKSDPAAQEAYKKNSRGWWQPPNEAITKD